MLFYLIFSSFLFFILVDFTLFHLFINILFYFINCFVYCYKSIFEFLTKCEILYILKPLYFKGEFPNSKFLNIYLESGTLSTSETPNSGNFAQNNSKFLEVISLCYRSDNIFLGRKFFRLRFVFFVLKLKWKKKFKENPQYK